MSYPTKKARNRSGHWLWGYSGRSQEEHRLARSFHHKTKNFFRANLPAESIGLAMKQLTLVLVYFANVNNW